MKCWYAVNTKLHSEAQACASLGQVGVEAFLPMLKEQKIVRGKYHTVVAPLFPGYLFARFQVPDQFRAVAFARGVKRVVSFGAGPSVVDESIVEAIRCRATGDVIELLDSRLSPGQVVRLQEGPLLGLEAVFEKKLSGASRAVLLLKAISFQARIIVGTEQVANF